MTSWLLGDHGTVEEDRSLDLEGDIQVLVLALVLDLADSRIHCLGERLGILVLVPVLHRHSIAGIVSRDAGWVDHIDHSWGRQAVDVMAGIEDHELVGD